MKIEVGKVYTVKDGDLVVTEIISSVKVKVRFINTGYEREVGSDQIKAGSVKDFMTPRVFGVGYLGKPLLKHQKRANCTWNSMLQRCYGPDPKYQNYKDKGVTVDPHWHNFQNFYSWFEENYREGFALDKDILSKGSLLYSEETCCFIPKYLNSALTFGKRAAPTLPVGVRKTKYGKFPAVIKVKGYNVHIGTYTNREEAFSVYKELKELYLSELADKAYKIGDINSETRDAVKEFEVTPFP